MAKVPLTGKWGEGKFAFIDDSDLEACLRFHWRLGKNGYVYLSEGNTTWTIAHFILNHKPQRRIQPDHINRDKLDNHRINLRLVSPSDNLRNRGQVPSATMTRYVYLGPVRRGVQTFIARPEGRPQRTFRSIKSAAEYVAMERTENNS